MRQGKAVFFHIVRHPAVIAAALILILTLAALGMVACFVWQPARAGAANADIRLERATAQLRDLRYRVRLAQNYVLRLSEAEALESKLRQVKPEPAFVRDIETLAVKSGATVEQVSSRSEERRSAINTAFFELILKGRYGNIRQFVAGLPELNEFVAIERVSIERDGEAVRAFLVMKRRHKIE
jgi:Tfp pilus assembly protein PilO